MIDQGAAEKAMIVYSEKASCDVPDYIAMHAALQAYEAARPKLPTITGLPQTLPDGTPIVGWKWGMTEPGDWHMSEVNNGMRKTNFGGYLRVIAITEATDG